MTQKDYGENWNGEVHISKKNKLYALQTYGVVTRKSSPSLLKNKSYYNKLVETINLKIKTKKL